jgi:hypothetical protein
MIAPLAQANLHWLALLLPPQLALAWIARSAAPR